MIRTSIIAASLALGSLGAAVSTQASAASTVYVQVAPPAPRVEVVPAVRRGMVWAPGHWDWRGRQYVWITGYYVRARPGYVYHEPMWEQRGERWYKRPGAWQRGDRDGDGVPNRFDNPPNNPNRR